MPMVKNSTFIFVYDNSKCEKWDLIDIDSLKMTKEIEFFIETLSTINFEPEKKIIDRILNYAKY